MDPTLNPPHKEYLTFPGAYNKQMGVLLAAGATPLSVADVMRKRLEVYHSTPGAVRDQLMQGWLFNYFDTVDGIAYNGDRAKIVPKSPLLLGITPQSPLKDGALVITPDVYGSLEGTDLTKKQLGKAGINDRLPKSRVVAHPGWQALVAGDKQLLREYADLIFSLVKEQYKEDTAMGFYITGEQGPSVRSWFLDWLVNRSNAYAMRHLGDSDARLVGVRTVAGNEARTLQKTLEAVIRYELLTF